MWTFKIRQGVRFDDGSQMTTQDVAETFNRLADPKVGSNALSTFAGVLSKGNTEAVDHQTVRFKLDAPNGNFPHIVSSDNYNAIIIPRNYDGNWQKTFIATGPWKMKSFTPEVGVTYVRNPYYWGPRTVADTSELKFYAQEQAAVLGLQGNQVDVLPHFSVAGGRSLLTDPSIRTTQFHSAAYREIHLRCDKEPFTDKRVRQAMALLADRRGMVQGLLATKSDYGNDSPFAPIYPSTDKSVAQRQRDVNKAKQLLEAAGHPHGFSVPVNTSNDFELPDLAQVLQDNVAVAGVKLNITISDLGTYYGSSTFGTSPWLDSVVGITDYGHRGRAQRDAEGDVDQEGALERRALPQQPIRQARRRLHRRARPAVPAPLRAPDPGAAARRVAAGGPVLLLLPDRGSQQGLGRILDRDGPGRPQPSGARLIGRFVGKRVALGLITLVLLSIFVFFGSQVLPGDVGRRVLGPFATPAAVAFAQPPARGPIAPSRPSTGTG